MLRPGGRRCCAPIPAHPVPALSEWPTSAPRRGVHSKAGRCRRARSWPFLPVSACRRLLATCPRQDLAGRPLSGAALTWAGCGASPLRALSWGRAAVGALRSSLVSPAVASAQPAVRALSPGMDSAGPAATAVSPAPRARPGPSLSLAPVVPSPVAPWSPLSIGFRPASPAGAPGHLRTKLTTRLVGPPAHPWPPLLLP